MSNRSTNALLLLAQRHPQLRPAPGTRAEALCLQWTLHLANTLQPAFRTWFYPHEAAGEAVADQAKALARSRNMPEPATRRPALAAYATRMKARPSFATLYAREGLSEWA